jgi:hypothetical protein
MCWRRTRTVPTGKGDIPGSRFPTCSGRRLSRREAAAIIRRIAGQAKANQQTLAEAIDALA